MAKHHSGSYYVRQAERAGVPVKPGKGDHMKVFAPPDGPYRGDHVTVPLHRELATGTEHTIRKFFIKVGIPLAILIGLAAWLL
jgi:hypothetical protein